MNPVAKKLVGYGAVGLVIAIALIAGLQVRPQSLLPSAGTLQVLITGDPLTSDPLTVTCHGDHPGQVQLTSLMVNISSVQVHRTGAFDLTGDWIPIPGAPKTLDLLDLKSFNQLLGSTSMPDGVINLVRLTVGPTATASIGTSSATVTVSSGHLDAQTNAQVTSGKVTSITLEVVQPHVICDGKGFRLTPELTATSNGPD
jgi:hypothetical protein